MRFRHPETPLRSRLIPRSSARSGDDPIFALHAEAVRRAAAGESVINSTLGALMLDDGRLAVMPAVFEAYRRVSPERAAAYAPISGPRPFLSAVVQDLLGGTSLAPFAVAAATPGGTGACHHAVVNFLEVGQALLTTSYYWSPYRIIAEHTQRGLETFSMFDASGVLDTVAMETALHDLIERQGRGLVFVNAPCHNPTGYSLDAADWKRLVAVLLEAAERAPVALLLDFAYARFSPPGTTPWTEHVGELLGKVTLLGAWTASKAYAQYGARIGALVAIEPDETERKRIQNALAYSCRGTWSNCNHLGMLAITELVRDDALRAQCDRERDELRRLLDERVRVFNRLAREAGLAFPRYEGGFFVSVFTPDPQRTCERMKERGVFVVPLQGAVRVALCSTPARDVPRLVEALAHGVERVPSA